MMVGPAPNIIRKVRADLALPLQEGRVLKNPSTHKGAREERCV
jgi:hypothetical protein